jgi:MFS family permease
MFPSSYLATRFPTAKYMACCSLAWSIVTLMYAAVHNWAGIMVLRALMGALEAVISPGITLIMASFYKKREQPWR